MKSSAFISSPVVQLMPLSRKNVQDSPSFEISHLLASPGSTCQFLSRRISGSVKWSRTLSGPRAYTDSLKSMFFQPRPVCEAAWTVYCFSGGAASAGSTLPNSFLTPEPAAGAVVAAAAGAAVAGATGGGAVVAAAAGLAASAGL